MSKLSDSELKMTLSMAVELTKLLAKTLKILEIHYGCTCTLTVMKDKAKLEQRFPSGVVFDQTFGEEIR